MKRFLFPALAAVAGILILLALFPRHDPSASLGLTFDRDQAFKKAKQIASGYGVDTTGWQQSATQIVDGPLGPVKIKVALKAPRADRYVEVTFYPDGQMAAWHPYGVSTSQPAIEEKPSTAAKATPKPARRVVTRNGGSTITVEEFNQGNNAPNYWPLRVIPTLCYLAAILYFPIAAIRRRLHYRVPLILMAVQIVWGLISYWGTSIYQNVTIQQLTNSRSLVGQTIEQIKPSQGWAFLWMLVLPAVGFSIRAVGNRDKWSSMELLTRGGFRNRAVGASLATGALSGIGIASLPYLVASVKFFGGGLVLRSMDVLVAPSVNATAWSLQPCVPVLLLFAYIYPLTVKIRNRYLRWGLFVPAGIAIGSAIGFPLPFNASAPNLAAAVLLFAGYTLVYLYGDMLAVMAAAVAAQAALAPCVLLAQPGGAVRATAVSLLVVGAVAIALSLHSAVRGREGVEAIADVPSADPAMENTETGRVRLEAEFDVARKAQEDALPGVAPALNGYTLAGSCTPAQQVGGDLYDYMPLSDGRLAITVADVSGKGVPAALYMMVTKGLLAAATRDSNDLAYILGQINLHLHRVCKKKVFVTLAAVALDAPHRRLQHGRAGHNPTLWRRTGRGETVILKPAGLGLGMASNQMFNRSLKIEEMELEPGDAIVLYSDGITEAVDATMEQYGENRLIRALEQTDGQPAETSRASILRDLASFVGTTPARDDVTLVVLRVDPEFAVT